MARQTTSDSGSGQGLLAELPVDRLKTEALELGKALGRKGVSRLGERLSGATGKGGALSDLAPSPGDVVKAAAKAVSPLAPVKDAASKVKDALPGTGSGGSEDSGSGGGSGQNQAGDDTNLKVTNIVEAIDVPVTRDVAYDLWTQFEEFPSFMKKVETVKQKDPEVVVWKAQIFWSHRTWTSHIVDQVPPERIVWKSEADKGRVDGAVTFHELAPDLTRVLVSLEYHPQGLFERTGNLWRAQGRRVRLEMRHFRRYVANHALMQQEDVDGWEGEIHDGQLKRRRSSSSSTKNSNGSAAKKSSSTRPAKRTAKKTAKKSATSKSSTSRPTKKSASGRRTAAAAKKSTSKRTTAPAKKASRSKRASSGSRS
jgi:uncharacterized membrane protein